MISLRPIPLDSRPHPYARLPILDGGFQKFIQAVVRGLVPLAHLGT